MAPPRILLALPALILACSSPGSYLSDAASGSGDGSAPLDDGGYPTGHCTVGSLACSGTETERRCEDANGEGRWVLVTRAPTRVVCSRRTVSPLFPQALGVTTSLENTLHGSIPTCWQTATSPTRCFRTPRLARRSLTRAPWMLRSGRACFWPPNRCA